MRFFIGGDLMYQTARGDNLYQGTLGPGTTVVSGAPTTVKRLVWGGTYVGTIALYDSSTAAGTAATNEIVSVGLPLAVYPKSLELNYHCTNGLVVTETGTPTHKVIWGE